MSSVLEKTFSGLVSSILGPASAKHSVSQGLVGVPGLKNVSLGLVNFVEKLQAARKISKQEEEHVVEQESKQWIQLLSSPGVDGSLVADVLSRALIAHLRGYPTPAILIHAIKLTQSSHLLNKRIGYLFVSQSLGPGSDLTLLLVNTVQRDLSAANVLEVSAALATLPAIVTPELAPAILPHLTHCLPHHQAYVRRRAASMVGVVAGRCGGDVMDASLVPHLLHLLTDHDPGVALAAVMALAKLYKVFSEDKRELRDQVARSAAHMLVQAVNGALPKDYQLNSLPAPFVQIQMLRVLKSLSSPEWQVPGEVTEALEAVLGQPWGGKEMALYAVLLEAVFTTTALPQQHSLLNTTLKLVLGFLKSSNVDLKYIGLRALASVFAVLEEALTPSHLEAVLDCLYHSDNNLQAKTLKLLCAMANSLNYQAVCSTLLEFSGRSNDHSTRANILGELASIVGEHCVDTAWCVELLTPPLVAAPPDPRLTTAIVKVLRQGFSDDKTLKSSSDASQELLLKLFNKGNISVIDLNLVADLLNLQYSNDPKLVSKYFTDSFLEKVFNEKHLDESSMSVFECLKNVGLHDTMVCKDIIDYLQIYVENQRICLTVRELAHEMCVWLEDPEVSSLVIKTQEEILKQKIEVDLTLSFLDEYVISALENGALPLKPFGVSMNSGEDKGASEEPPMSSSSLASTGSEDAHSSAPSTATHLTVATTPSTSKSVVPNKRVWSSEGRVRKQSCGEPSGKPAASLGAEDPSGSLRDDEEDVTEGSVEMADEAQEDQDEAKDLDTSALQRSQLTQALLAGLGMTRPK